MRLLFLGTMLCGIPTLATAAWDPGYVLIDFGVHVADGEREVILDTASTGNPFSGEVLWQADPRTCRIQQRVVASPEAKPEWVPLRDSGLYRGRPAHADVTAAQALAILAEKGRTCEVGGKDGEFVSIAPGVALSTKTPESDAPLGKTVFLVRPASFLWPKEITIKVGERVVWIYADGQQSQHTISSGACQGQFCPESGKLFDSKLTLVKPGDRFEHTFTTPGTYAYHCDTHTAVMQGTITVHPK